MKGTANIPLENIAQLSQASHILILFSIGFSVGCVIGYKNVFLWTLWCSDIFDFSCHLHGNVVASKAASRSHSKWESLVLISPLFSVGDGANDVSMIQVADTGVGILGQEGMQVVYTKTAASDIRIHFKSVQLTLEAQWLHSPLLCPGGGTVCILSSHPCLCSHQEHTEADAAGVQTPNSRACCLNSPSFISCHAQASVISVKLCGNNKDRQPHTCTCCVGLSCVY